MATTRRRRKKILRPEQEIQLATNVARQLTILTGHPWACRPIGVQCFIELGKHRIHVDGQSRSKKIIYSGTWLEKKKYEEESPLMRSTYLQNATKLCSTTTSMSTGPQAMAQTIKRRLLPRYEEALKQLPLQEEEAEALSTRKTDSLNHLIALYGLTPHYIDTRHHTATYHKDPLHEIEIDNDLHAHFTLVRLTIETALPILTLARKLGMASIYRINIEDLQTKPQMDASLQNMPTTFVIKAILSLRRHQNNRFHIHIHLDDIPPKPAQEMINALRASRNNTPEEKA